MVRNEHKNLYHDEERNKKPYPLPGASLCVLSNEQDFNLTCPFYLVPVLPVCLMYTKERRHNHKTN